jgi:hypothetical protein
LRVPPGRTVKVLDAASAAYIAGLVDGEGTITLSRLHAKENRRLVVSISNNDSQLLAFVLGCVGAGKITRKRTYQPQHAPAFAFQLSGRQALALLLCIAPYLRSYKAKRAQLALESYLAVTPRNGKYTPELLTARLAFERRFFAMRP